MSDSRAPYQLELFGAFRLLAPDAARIDIPSRRGRALLAMLATASHGERTRAWLEDKLWGNRPQAQARGSLRRELSNLRALLNQGEMPLLVSDRDKVRLDLNQVTIDVRQSEARDQTDCNFSLMPGDFLEGLDIADAEGFEEWLRDQRSASRSGQARTREFVDASRSSGSGGVALVATKLTTPITHSAEMATISLAVLPFDNLSDDIELAYFCDGVAEEIQQTVAQGSDLKVLARSSSFQFRGADKNVDKVAAALGVTHLLDGSVRRSGSRVRISAELVECASRRTMWGHRYDGDLSDIFALQEGIAEGVARALKVKLAPPAASAVLDPAVYEVFLQARGLLAEGSPLFDNSAADATPLLEQVVGQAPGSAAAWELLAIARAWTLRTHHGQRADTHYRAGVLDAANRALSLDSSRGGAYGALAMLEPWGAYAVREKLLGQALAAVPRDPAALTEMGTFCWTVGRFHEALHLAERACELNPLMPSARLQVAQMLTYTGAYEASIRMLQELHHRWPKNAGILLSLINFSAALGFWDAYDKAIVAVETFAGWQAKDLHASRAYAETLRTTDPDLRAERLRRYTELLEKTGTLPLNLVQAISDLGMPEQALDLAERASYAHIFDPDGAPPSGYFPGTVLGRWSALNKTPRFIGLCDRLGLCAYWVQSGRWPDCAHWTPYDFKAEVRRRIASPSATVGV